MLEIRHVIIALGMLLCSMGSSAAQVSIGIGLPNVSIGINLPVYPELVRVPGYPVYYAPRLAANFFFYDSMYWVYLEDNWYASSWYNGPWAFVAPEFVPLFVLRIPVRYYRQPPAYFRGWRSDAPPRWGDHWGRDWEQRRSGWDRWDHRAVPTPAPLPVYQRQYSGARYPHQLEQQQQLQQRNYRYRPRDPVVQQHYQGQAVPRTPVQQGSSQQERWGAPEDRGSRQQERFTPHQQEAPAVPRSRSQHRRGEDVQRPIPSTPQQGRPEVQDRGQQRPDQRKPQAPRSQGREERQQDKDATREQKREQERGRGRNE